MNQEENNLQQELESLSSILAKQAARDDGFRAPEGYFAQTVDDFFRRKEEATPKSAVFNTLYLRRIAAAVVILSAGIGFFYRQTIRTAAETDFFAGISDAEITIYIEENIDDFGAALLLESGAELSLSEESWLPAFENGDADKLIDELMYEIDQYDLEDFF